MQQEVDGRCVIGITPLGRALLEQRTGGIGPLAYPLEEN
jgi:hypothetical protein